ncbi:MAG TPA: peptidylprolyl isomerase [bacterium]|nr:peptidylprolyl isomerase [bacterium]
MRKALYAIMMMAIIVSFAACDGMNAGGSAAAPEGAKIASVDNQPITDQQILQMVQAVRDPRQLYRFTTDDGKKDLLDKLIDMELVYKAAKSESLQNDPEVKKMLDGYAKQLLFVFYLQKHMEEAGGEVNEAAAQKYYDEHPDEFQQGEQVKARHILIKVDENADEATVAAAKKKIEGLAAKVKGGADFAKLAEENSDDPGSKKRGGDLGFFGRGRMVPEFDEAAFGLAVGEVSAPVKSKFGFHIIKVEERKDSTKREFAEIKDQLMRKMSFENQQKAYDDIVGKLRAKANIQIDEEALKALKIPMPQFGGGQPGMQLPAQLQGAKPAQP